MARRPDFVKTAKQVEACDLINSHRHSLLDGGARSGKSLILVRNCFLRALKKPSRHLIVRYRFNHAKVSLMHETIPYVLRHCFPGIDVQENKADSYYSIPTVEGSRSEIWIGGTDDQSRVEKILGTEYSTIYANECSQISFDAITTLWTRLAETSGLELRFYYDCNPPGRHHWIHKMFYEGMLPDGTRHDLDCGVLKMNPKDNADNLPPDYLQILKGLPKRQRMRFLDGIYLSDVEGALWTDDMIARARLLEPGFRSRTVVAVDPAVTNTSTSDECGIVVCSLDADGRGVVEEDLSAKVSTRTWAQRVVNAYYAYEANEVVAEVNQGGDLVADAIHNVDPTVRVVKVRASKGKFARAEPVSMLYEQDRVCHPVAMPQLEAELTEWVPANTSASPNRLDALVWGLTHLMIGKTKSLVHMAVVS